MVTELTGTSKSVKTKYFSGHKAYNNPIKNFVIFYEDFLTYLINKRTTNYD